MNFKTLNAAELAVLESLSDADLMAPIHAADSTPAHTPTAPVAVSHFGSTVRLPSLEVLLAQADEVASAQSTAELPATPQRPSGIPADETVSPLLRGNGGRLSEALRRAVGEHIKSADDLRYALRVFAAHAVSSLVTSRRGVLSRQEYEASASVHVDWQKRILTAVKGEVAAIQAGAHLSVEEFKFMLELVDSNRGVMAQNLAGPEVDVSAIAAGRGTDWRELADAWADVCTSRGTVTFDTGKSAAGWTSYSIEVHPGAGWVLSVYVDSRWIPIEASAAGKDEARAARKQVMLARSQSALPRPYLGNVFPDALGDSA